MDTQTHRHTDGHFDLKKASIPRADVLKSIFSFKFGSLSGGMNLGVVVA